MTKAAQWQIQIADTTEDYLCGPEEHLLKGMLRLGRKGIPSGCHGGGCGVCKVLILSGEVETRVMSRAHVTEQEQAEGYALACRCFPRSDLHLKVIGKIAKTVCRNRYGLV